MTDENDLLNPKNTPSSLSAKTEPPKRGVGVRKVNKVPILIGSGVGVVMLLTILYTANQRSHHHQSNSTTDDTSNMTAATTPDKTFDTSRKPKPQPSKDGNKTDTASSTSTSTASPPSQPVVMPQPVSPYSQQWQAYYQAQQQLQQQRNQEVGSALTTKTSIEIHDKDFYTDNGKNLQNNSKPVDSNYLTSYRTGARNALEVKEGTIIPAALIGAINSDKPGMIKAQVRQNVYDSATGNTVLIPQGSSIVGFFRQTVSYGQNRIDVVFDRIIFPDQSSVDLGSMQGADVSGNSGFKDKVNTHWWKIMGNALLVSAFSAGVQLSQNPNTLGSNNTGNNGYNAQQIVAAQVGMQTGQLGMQLAERGLNIPPTVTIRPGYKFNIMVRKDMVLPAYQDRWGNGDVHYITQKNN
ncbi:TrbI/VirB10 family protein [Commensalibacter nepenthis]|uniref:TrbI/VirB10 family protein n=1 Tax=Commensalibacter nepenthis TaxID=3043872 RepID=A0ABT6QC65_9PROT|nr:TrbI/VirB10 family protein [Commensalibacter sp. TBRC 10068]MDI2113883.1 TrbI/VirB10 family protein [Commensalibacter sp. TBRC 10068]